MVVLTNAKLKLDGLVPRKLHAFLFVEINTSSALKPVTMEIQLVETAVLQPVVLRQVGPVLNLDLAAMLSVATIFLLHQNNAMTVT